MGIYFNSRFFFTLSSCVPSYAALAVGSMLVYFTRKQSSYTAIPSDFVSSNIIDVEDCW